MARNLTHPKQPKKFTDHFGLSVDQRDLDFLDIYADEDMPVFLDPYGIAAMGTDWSRQCEMEIRSYFQYLIDCIRAGDRRAVAKILDALHEVDEVALGFSSGVPRGRGIGRAQAQEIQFAFENSEAGKSGDIKDIADCALMIPGINRDKISDITANILKKQLITFTQEQCRSLSIPMRRVPVSNVFDLTTFKFVSSFAELPVINNRPKILLPVSSIRIVPELSKDKYYRKYVLQFLKAEHEHAGDSLSSVLRDGTVVVRIKDLKKEYPLSAEFLHEFSKEHPIILDNYKKELRKSAKQNSQTRPLKTQRKHLSVDERIGILQGIAPGNDGATAFHKISFDSLIYIFGERLSRPLREKDVNNGRKRIDIVFDNSAKEGFFRELNDLHHVKCPKIMMECKNYGKEIGNPELDQLAGRFTSRRGMFGILVCRSVADRAANLKRRKDLLDHGDHILVLDDADLGKLLRWKEDGKEEEIDNLLRDEFDKLIM